MNQAGPHSIVFIGIKLPWMLILFQFLAFNCCQRNKNVSRLQICTIRQMQCILSWHCQAGKYFQLSQIVNTWPKTMKITVLLHVLFIHVHMYKKCSWKELHHKLSKFPFLLFYSTFQVFWLKCKLDGIQYHLCG